MSAISSNADDVDSYYRDEASEIGEGISHVDANYDASAIVDDDDDEAPAAG
jgi:hypothetical protein